MLGSTEKIKRVGIPINLQFFADGGTGDEDDSLNDSELDVPGDSWTPPASKDDYTKKLKDVSFKAREKAKRSMLKQLGFENLESGKKLVAEYTELKRGIMTESEKLTKQIEDLTKERDTYKTKLDDFETESVIIKAGVDPTKLVKAKALINTYEGKDFAEKLKAFTEDTDNSPFLSGSKKTETNPKPNVKPKSNTDGGSTSGLAELRAKLGRK